MGDSHEHCRIERHAGKMAYEFTAFAWPLSQDAELWPARPGAARFDDQSQPVLMHFAPGRWLAPEPTAELLSLLSAAQQAATGTLVNVSGKWDQLWMRGPGAARLLACTIDWQVMLEQRDCAAVTLFDCPAIVARAADGFAVWVQSSYTSHFLSTAEKFRASLEGDA